MYHMSYSMRPPMKTSNPSATDMARASAIPAEDIVDSSLLLVKNMHTAAARNGIARSAIIGIIP